MSIKADPVYSAIQDGIKADIEFCLQHKRLRATVILIYAGIDTMATLDMPAGQGEVTREDFIRWTERYIRFQSKERPTGLDLYGARCGYLHSYGSESRLSKQGKCRQIGYVDQCDPEVRYDAKASTELMIVSIGALKRAFFEGIDAFLVDVYANKKKAPVVDGRLTKLFCSYDMDEDYRKERPRAKGFGFS
jgi:hypothetical protein